MRKTLVIVAAFFIMLFLCLPYFMGHLVERKMLEWNTLILTKVGFNVEVKEYHRYWFSSKVVLYLTMSQPIIPIGQSEDQPKGLLLISHIKHGPIIFDESEMGKLKIFLGQAVVNSELIVPIEYKTFFAKYLTQTSLLDSQTVVHFDGSVDTHMNSKELQIKDPDMPGTFVGWNNFSSHWKLNRNFSEVQSKIQFGDMILGVTPEMSFNFSNVRIEKKYARGEYGLWFGESKFNIPFMTMIINGKNRIVAKELVFSSSHQQQGNVVNSLAEVDVDQIIINEHSYGPGDFQIALKNLDKEALFHMTEFLQTFGEKEEVWDDPTKQKAINLLTQLLSQGFQARINPFYLETTDGEINIQAWLTLPILNKTQLESGLPLLVQKADASLMISLPKIFVDNALLLFYQRSSHVQHHGTTALSPKDLTQAQIKEWLKNNWLTVHDQFYELSVVYKNNHLLVNGLEIPVLQ